MLEGGDRQGGGVMILAINFKLNGNAVGASAESSASLLEFLRDTLNFKGTKLCCNTGECGACTVLFNGKPINSCVTLAADAEGAEIVTVEGLAEGDKLHPVQQAFIDTGAVQCGYCTPGFIVSVKALLDRTKKPTPAEIEEAVSGNICRCTGYAKIVDAIQLAAQRL
jgi:carbon-monoxide dehydrogenase small subunit